MWIIHWPALANIHVHYSSIITLLLDAWTHIVITAQLKEISLRFCMDHVPHSVYSPQCTRTCLMLLTMYHACSVPITHYYLPY